MGKVLFVVEAGTRKDHNAHTNDFGKRLNKVVLLMVQDKKKKGVTQGSNRHESVSQVPMDECARLTQVFHKWHTRNPWMTLS